MNHESAPEGGVSANENKEEARGLRIGDKFFPIDGNVVVVRDKGRGPVERDWKVVGGENLSEDDTLRVYRQSGDVVDTKIVKVSDFLKWQDLP